VGPTGVEKTNTILRTASVGRALDRGAITGDPVLVHSQLGGIDAVRGEDSNRGGGRGEDDVCMREVFGEPGRARLEPGPVDLAFAGAGVDHDTAGLVVAVDEELPCADPPEVVHGDDDPRPCRPGRRQQPGADRLERMEVDNVGTHTPHVLGEVGSDSLVVVAIEVVPPDPRPRRDPSDLHAGLFHLTPRGRWGSLRVEAAGVDAHVVPTRAQPSRHSLRGQRAAAHEVRGIMGGDHEDAHAGATITRGMRANASHPLQQHRKPTGASTIHAVTQGGGGWTGAIRSVVPSGRRKGRGWRSVPSTTRSSTAPRLACSTSTTLTLPLSVRSTPSTSSPATSSTWTWDGTTAGWPVRSAIEAPAVGSAPPT